MKLPSDKNLVARTPGFQIPFAARIRTEAKVATMAVGLIIEPKQAEAILQSGGADLIALAREMLANPNFAVQAALELEGAVGWIKARTVERFDTGDHVIFLAAADWLETGPGAGGLVYVDRRYVAL